MTFEQEVFGAVENNENLVALAFKYGLDRVARELERQSRMQNALDYPKIQLHRFVVYSPNPDGIKWPDGARGGAYASITKTDHHDHPLWTLFWEDAANFGTAEEAESYRSKTVNGNLGRVMTIRQVIEEAFL